MTRHQRSLTVAALIFLGSLFLFTVGLAHQEIIGFESRFYVFAQEMLRHGFTGFPTVYQKLYPDYPVTSTLLIVWVTKILGGLTKLTAILPSAFAAALTVMITYMIGTLHSMRLSVCAVLMLLMTNLFVVEARTISLDQYITMLTTLGFYLLYSADELHKPKRLWLIPIVLILGFMLRGPIGLVIPAGVISMYCLLAKQWQRLLALGFVAVVILLVTGLLLLLLAKQVGGNEFMQAVIRMQVGSRLHDLHQPSHYLYLTQGMESYAVTFPLSVLVLLGYLLQYKKLPTLLLQLSGWVLVILLGLSVPADKQVRYILPLSPALALIAAHLFLATRQEKYLYYLQQIFIWFCRLLPLLCLILLSVLHKKLVVYPLHWPGIYAVFIILQVLMLWHVKSLQRDLITVALAVCTFFSVELLVIEPINQALNRTRDFVLQVEHLRATKKAQLVFYREGQDGLPIKYLVHLSLAVMPQFVDSANVLATIKNPLIICAVENCKDIPKSYLPRIKGWIGRKEVIVLMK